MRHLTYILTGLACAACTAAAAQTTVEELTVQGHHGADTKAYPVSYADIDIRTPDGKRELNRRIHVTAKWVCKQLGEPVGARVPKPNCESIAVRDAGPMVEKARHAALAHRGAWKAGAAWTPPPGVS
jgi:UrcA family protein